MAASACHHSKGSVVPPFHADRASRFIHALGGQQHVLQQRWPRGEEIYFGTSKYHSPLKLCLIFRLSFYRGKGLWRVGCNMESSRRSATSGLFCCSYDLSDRFNIYLERRID